MNDFAVLNSFRITGAGWARAWGTVIACAVLRIASLNNSAQTAATNPVIGWANLQWPQSITHTISTTNRTENIFGQVWIDGVTSQAGATTNLVAQLGYGPEGSIPQGNSAWVWLEAAFNVDAGNNDEFKATLLPESTGSFDYLYRYSTSRGRDWFYADANGPIGKGQSPVKPGKLAVKSSGDTNAPVVPTGLTVKSTTAAGIDLVWSSASNDPTLYGYEVLRSGKSGGPYTTLARVTNSAFSDATVRGGTTYFYVVRAVDQSFNRSSNSTEVNALMSPRKVTVTFNLTVPPTTETARRSVNIAGNLDTLEGGFREWDPSGAMLSRVSATQWTISLTGKEGSHLEYKYALESWDYAEKSATCEEIANRELTLTYGTNGQQTVNDSVLKWRNVAPCGN